MHNQDHVSLLLTVQFHRCIQQRRFLSLNVMTTPQTGQPMGNLAWLACSCRWVGSRMLLHGTMVPSDVNTLMVSSSS